MSEEVASLVFGEGVRSLQNQVTALDGLRSRTGLLLSAASLVTSFFSGIALGDPRQLDGWGWIATAFFVLVAVISIALLWPRYRWSFTSNPKDLVQDYLDDPDVSVVRAQRNLAIHMGNAYADNDKKLKRMYTGFALACGALVFEVLAWIADIVRR